MIERVLALITIRTPALRLIRIGTILLPVIVAACSGGGGGGGGPGY